MSVAWAHARQTAAACLKPPLKWAGGKRWLVPKLRALWSSHRRRRLVEPFCGGLAVALGLEPARALLNDINPHTVNFYRQIQRGLYIKLGMRNDEDWYYECRETFNRLVTGRFTFSRKAAELFYYLNRTGFNGLCRFNARGEFNVPFGRYKKINYVRDFSSYRPPMARWSFECQDFETLAPTRSDFVYADPPYDVEFTAYSRGGFGWGEQERLARWLAARPGPVVASNQATPRILELYGDLGFDIETLEAPRNIACNGDRRPAIEMLATRNLPGRGR